MKGRVVALVLALAPAVVHAGSYGTELPFVAGAGARASGMGLAGAALPGTPSSQYYNPALLAFQEFRQLELYRTTLFDAKSTYLAAAYAHPTLDFGTLGLSLLRLDVGGIEERDDANALLSPDLHNTILRVLIGYAAPVTPSLSVGANLKIDHQELGDASGTGVGVDLGASAVRRLSPAGFLRNARAAVMIENLVEPTVKLDVEDVGDPMRLVLGASLDAYRSDFRFTTALDLASPRYSPVQVRAGEEVRYADLVALRFGVDDGTATAGLGVCYRGIDVDYAFRNEELGANHRFSLTMAFGASKSERRRVRQERADAGMRAQLDRRIHDFEAGQLAQLVARADSLFDAGDYENAGEQYGSVLAWDPTDIDAGVRRIECRFRAEVAMGQEQVARGDYVTALHHFRRADQARPNDATVATMIATCNDRIRDSRNRAAMVDALLRQSIDLYAQNRLPEALSGFRDVLRTDPDNPLAREYERKTSVAIDAAVDQALSRSRERVRQGDAAGAIDILENAEAVSPGDARVETRLAALRARAAAPTGAVSPAPPPTPAADVDEAVLSPRYREGVRRFEEGDFAAAAKELQVVWTAAPGYRDVTATLTRAYLLLGMRAYSDGRYDEAIATWEKALTVDPGNGKARRYLKNARDEASRLGAMKP
jgi:tetratricopeptide (TPR) repeat protein